ncbi:PAS domain S-box protein [Horticoccus luteus]|uniref:PAS domain S-box protein n=1 Tax=Horticoccus luteus TaxID=2862869 RepID=A0A8F9XHH8_9BACT|nr:chemotaxis protein CheB [Horticoccus luteus]QYM79345.1 PAS domain S-box protein [Horticoccus luteus]
MPPPKKSPGHAPAPGPKRTATPRAARKKASPRPSFPVVGIGASAGGLEAFIALLKALPVDTGMGFVVVQHLAPTQDGMLPKLLAKTTSMPVWEVSDGMIVEPNQIYVIPSNKSMSISGGALNLLPRQVTQGPVRSIDFFLKSLAQDRGNEAIGIILSGTASDGTMGLEAIKAEGGITFAQDDSAKFDSMPRSAIAADCVDFVLAPAAIAAELARLARHPYVRQPRDAEPEDAPVPEAKPGDDFTKVRTLLRRRVGTDFAFYKPATLHRRLHRRMVLGEFSTLAAYITFLETHPAELEILAGDFLIGVTNFFRDPAAFAVLKRKIFPRLLKLHDTSSEEGALRIWVLGCSTGQEAYSIAMAWLEFARAAGTNTGLQIFCTDVHGPYVDRARAAVYSRSLVQDVSAERLRNFFVEVEGGYRVSKTIRDMCVFARQNVLTDPPFSHLDLISCRNMLIYIRADLQKKIVPTFHFALKPGGVLFLGPAETVSGFADLFAPLDPKNKFFTRRPSATNREMRYTAQPPAAAKVASAPLRLQTLPPAATGDAQREADRLMLAKHAPVGVLVTADLDVLQFRGATGLFLEASSGKASLNLLKMAREGLFSPLRRTINKAVKDQATMRSPAVTVKSPGQTLTVVIEVIPLKTQPEAQPCLLVNFHRVEPAAATEARPTAPPATDCPPADGRRKTSENVHLLHELAETKEHLQSVIEQQDAYNEELQSANEEAQAGNEELQSINEEMETAKEELQAGNEELTTLNEELSARNDLLGQTSNDLSNLMTSAQIPAVILTRDLRVRRFTPRAEQLLGITAADVGRPLADLALRVPVLDLKTTLVRVIDTVTAHEEEVQNPEGRWFSLRIHPYVTTENKIDGAVLVFVDVGGLKRAQTQLIETRDYAANIVETVGDALLVLDSDLIVQTANHAYYDLFLSAPQETEQKSIYALGNGQWKRPEFRAMLEKILPDNERIHNYDLEGEFPRLGRRIFRLNARRIRPSATSRPLILIALGDVTEQRAAAQVIHASENRYRRLFEAARDGVLIVDPTTRRILDANPYIVQLLGETCAELVGQDLRQIGLFADEDAARAAFETLATKHVVRFDKLTLTIRSGETRDVEVLANLYVEDGRAAIQCNIRDITERGVAEERYRESAGRFRAMAESMLQKIFAAGPDGVATYFNRQWLEFTGTTLDELLTLGWQSFLHPDDVEPTKRRWRQAIDTGAMFELEHRLRRHDGVHRWHLSRARATADAEGRIVMWIGSSTDIDEQKRVEEKLELMVAERTTELKAIIGELETFSYAMAHDLRGPLRALQGYANILNEDYADKLDDSGQRFVRQIASAADRMHKLVTDVLTLTRLTRAPLPLQAVALRPLVETVIEQYPALKDARIQLSGAFPTALANPSALTQAIANLLTNAVKFVPAGRPAEVKIFAEETEREITLFVTDQGLGIPTQDQQRIFQLFERAHGTEHLEGSGIGLSIVRRTVERMGGSVGVKSRPGEGSTFWLTLRRPEASP